jgi:maltose alpha-D-glucosyltransferase/alpha-amylase
MFLRNHDELTLEMVTDEDRDYMYRVYAQDPQARINLGIRRRLAPLLENHRGKIELMDGLLFALPGTPVIYYGDEIGMGDNIYLGDRNGVRTPMQWSAERNAGFSKANPQRLYFPLIIDPTYHYELVNVEAQQHNPYSLLWWTKRLIGLRKQYRAFGRGTLEFLTPDNPKVLAFVRRYGDERILVVANLSRLVQYVEMDLNAFKGLAPVEMMGRTALPGIGDRPYPLTLGAYAFYWFSLEPVPSTVFPVLPEERELPLLEVAGDWKEVLHGKAREALQEALPGYLRQCHWFRERARQVEVAMILETVPVVDGTPAGQVALVQVEFSEDAPETFVLPLGFATGALAEQVRRDRPQVAVARLRVTRPAAGDGEPATEGLLYDPLGERHFSQALLEAVARRRRFKGTGGEITGWRTRGFQPPAGGAGPEPALLRAGDHRNTLVVYGDQYLLKVYRRVEEGVNPGLELARFLSEKTSFTQIPPLLGALEYRRGWGGPLTLATMHAFVPNHGDGWHLAVDALGRYYEQALTEPNRSRVLPFPSKSFLELADEDPLPLAQEMIGPHLEAARLLGQRTAELHLALGSNRDDPAFAPEPFSTLYQRSLYQSLRTQSRRTLELLRKRAGDLPEPAQKDARRLLELEAELLKRIRCVFERKITAERLRCHGEYHLAQVLWTGKDWVIANLEGDPSRSFSQRRLKRSPLRDVASMVRSFHYAALCALGSRAVRPEDQATLGPWARFWHLWVSTAFLKAYLTAARGSFLPADRGELGTLLDFYLLKRAVNELNFEMTHHTEQVRVPLLGLLHLLEGGE